MELFTRSRIPARRACSTISPAPPDGSDPGPLVIANGKLYGPTTSGGDASCWLSYGGCGVIFQFDKSGTEKVLYTFNGFTDGAVPVGPLTFDSEGNMYGATTQGMKDNCAFWQGGCGTIWKLSSLASD